MEFEKDYIMRMIKQVVVALARIIFNKPGPMYELPEERDFTAVDDLYVRLLKLADAGKINEAENLLYEELEAENQGYLEMGIGFYSHINEYEEEFLREHNYTRDEINEGIERLLKEFGMGSLADIINM